MPRFIVRDCEMILEAGEEAVHEDLLLEQPQVLVLTLHIPI